MLLRIRAGSIAYSVAAPHGRDRFCASSTPSTQNNLLAAVGQEMEFLKSLFVGVFAAALAVGVFGTESARAQEVLLNGVPVVGSPNVVNQVAIPDGQTLTVDQGASIVTGQDAVVDAADGTTITVDNAGTITSTLKVAIDVTGSTLILVNSGTITSNSEDAIVAATITSLINSGTIISDGEEGIDATTIVFLNNSGLITGFEEGVQASTIQTLINSGTIAGDGVRAITIQNLINSGTINSRQAEAVRAVTIASLTNSGTLIGGNGTAIRETGAADTLLTLLAGSNIQGAINLGGGVNTLNVGNGLSISNTFVGAAPVIGNTFGAPFAVNGTQVAVLDPTSLSQHDEMLADLTSGIFNSVHARLTGVGSSSSNGFAEMSLGMGSMMQLGGGTMMSLSTMDVGPASAKEGSGLWAQAFGGNREVDASGPNAASDHEYYGGIAGIDGWLIPGIRIGAFGGGSRADMEFNFDTQDLEADSYFGGVYGSLWRNGWFAHFHADGWQKRL